jgi:alcohol dehydrogenase YqhD (iron-dependent ADH family)
MVITTFYLPTKIIFGPGSLACLGTEAAKLGRKAILVTGKSSLRKTGVLDRAVNDLKNNGVEILIYDWIEPNPRTATVDEGARLAREAGIDLVIGIGGGSVMDAAKGIVIASSGTRPVWDYIEKDIEVRGMVPRLMLIPTVAASGSEANSGAVITNWQTHEKCVLNSPHIYPTVSIVDPELTLTLPAKPTLQGGVDIFCHLVEPYVTAEKPSPLTDAIVEATLRLVVEYLPQALVKPDGIHTRSQLSWASTIACSPFVSLGGGDGAMTLHGIEHPLSGYYDIAHGDGLAALLLAWMRYTRPVRKERFETLGGNVFRQPDGIIATGQWLEKIGMNIRLSELCIEPERIAEIADNAVKTAPWLKKHPNRLDAKSIIKIYQDSF